MLDPMPPEGPLPEVLEPPTADKGLKAFFDMVRYREEYMNRHGALSSDDKENIINELDEEWPYRGWEITVSGAVIKMPPVGGWDEDNVGSETDEVKVEDIDFTSLGFSIVTEPVVIDGEDFGVYEHICHVLTRDETMVVDGVEVKSHEIYFAFLDRVHIEYPFLPSEEDILEKLTYYYPEQLADLRNRLKGHQNECEAVLALRGMYFDVGENEEPADLQPFSELLNSMVGFDKEPYRAEFGRNAVYATNAQDGHFDPLPVEEGILGGESRMAAFRIMSICQLPMVTLEMKDGAGTQAIDWSKIQFGLFTDYCAPDANGDMKNVLIPVNGLASLVPVRELIYGLQKPA